MALLYGVVFQAYDFSDGATSMIKPGFGYLSSILISLVAGIVIFVVAARVFLGFIENTERLESAETYRKKINRNAVKKTKRVAFSKTDTYKKIKEQKIQKAIRVEKEMPESIEADKTEQLSFEESMLEREEPSVVEEVKVVEQEELAIEEVVDTVVEEVQPEETIYEETQDEVQPEETYLDESKEEVEITEEAEVQHPNVLVTTGIGEKTTNKQYYTRLNKTELTGIVAKVTEISNYKAKKFMSALLDTIKDELVEGNDVKIDDFGKFSKKAVKEKTSRNPRTGDSLIVPAHNVVKFKAFKKFADDITNDVTDTSHRYLLTKKVEKSLSEDEVQNELIKEEKIKEHIEVNVIEKPKKKPKKKQVPKKTKTDIINFISSNTTLSKNKANIFLKYFAETVKETLVEKDDVKIQGLGTFTTIHIPSKEAVNPSNQEKIVVLEHNQVRLRFDKSFKDKFKQK